MLLAIRERIMGVVGWFILGLLIITFAFFGLNSYLQGDTKAYAAAVNGEEISLDIQNRVYQELRKRMQEMIGQNQVGLEDGILKAQALQQLISDSLIIQAARAEGFAASNQLLAARINSIDAFKKEGVFSKQKYERIVDFQGMLPSQFEQKLKYEIIANQLRAGIVKTAAASEKSLIKAYALEGQQRDFRYLMLSLSKLQDKATVTDQEVKDYYDNNHDAFMSDERVRIQYLELDAANINSGIEIDEQDLQVLYDEQYESYVTPEERHARHILIKSSPEADNAENNTALDKANDIVKRLKTGEAFDALAKELSEDPGSADNGGDLGYFGRGAMVAEFEQAVFGLKEGERTGVIKSSFGYHIIELIEIKPKIIVPLSEVRERLVDQLQRAERSDLFYQKSEDLSNLTFEQPDTLQVAAEAVGLKVLEAGWLGRNGGTGIAEIPGVIEAVFSEDVLLNGNNSAAIEIGTDHVVVLRVIEHQESALKAIEDVSEQAGEQARAEKARQQIIDKGGALLASLRQGDDTLESIAKSESLQLEQTGFIQRNAQKPEWSIISKVFSLSQPDSAQPVYDGFTLARGDYVIIALDHVKEGDFSELSEQERQQLWRSLSNVRGATEMAAVLSILEEQATINIPSRNSSPSM